MDGRMMMDGGKGEVAERIEGPYIERSRAKISVAYAKNDELMVLIA
jgi:hypothetical protein